METPKPDKRLAIIIKEYEGYIFFLGSDQWYGHTTMLGYKRSNMSSPCARIDDIAVNSVAFTQALEHFIAERAIKLVEVQKKI